MTNLIQSAVPGQSLTDSPKNSPWERPAQISKLEDVVTHYITKLADEEVMDDMAALFQMGADLETVTETMHTSGAMKGVHTVEVGLLAGPIVASFLKSMLSTYGIDAPEKSVSVDEAKESKEHGRLSQLIDAAISNAKQEDAGTDLLQELADVSSSEAAPENEQASPMPEVEEDASEAPTEMAEQGNGIMSRGAV
tara:strand:+ start:61 stop:645 length:585 start_codon:yes stop_codon:yes gene_type:complete